MPAQNYNTGNGLTPVPGDTPDAIPHLTPAELAADLDSFITAAVDCADALSKQARSRALSLVLTKLEEAEMWLKKMEGGE